MGMKSDAGLGISPWMAAVAMPMATLERDEEADICVVGAGISGLTTAYCLARDGRSVVVVDHGPVGGGETSRTTAHLVNALDDYYHEIERLHGENGARLAAESHSAAIDTIERIVSQNGIRCDFRRVDGYLVGAHDNDSRLLSEELHAAWRAGLSVEQTEHVPVDFHDFGAAVRFPHQAQFHPMKYLNGLAAALHNSGVQMYTGVHVTEVEDGDPVRVVAESGRTIRARAAVVATNTPILNRFVIHTKQAAYRTYALAARIAKGSMPPILLWDTDEPYHYVRTHEENGHDWLIVGGEDHKTGQAAENSTFYESLEAWMRERFPMAASVEFRWSGQVMEPVDGMGYIGRNPGDDDTYIVTGDSGNGMTHGTIAGLVISDLIAGRKNAWEKLYDPSRNPLRGGVTEFARENLNAAGQYAELLTGGRVASVSELAPGEGTILRRGVSKFAVYRDHQEGLHYFSATCPHLGCVVQWNGAEKTWDCPCHGSRFDKRNGHVLNGPATRGLTRGD
jgi:glycine/D-amino acid oxidase-like deaminating enzyme/nitrite reductase/ring-hydroxylating ferredoxin subunit